MSVFAQPDSESEELLKCGGEAILGSSESTIMTVSFHIRYRYTVTVGCLCWGGGRGLVWGHYWDVHTKHRDEGKQEWQWKNRIRGIKGIWEKNRETKGTISMSAKTSMSDCLSCLVCRWDHFLSRSMVLILHQGAAHELCFHWITLSSHSPSPAPIQGNM